MCACLAAKLFRTYFEHKNIYTSARSCFTSLSVVLVIQVWFCVGWKTSTEFHIGNRKQSDSWKRMWSIIKQWHWWQNDLFGIQVNLLAVENLLDLIFVIWNVQFNKVPFGMIDSVFVLSATKTMEYKKCIATMRNRTVNQCSNLFNGSVDLRSEKKWGIVLLMWP